MWVPIWWSDVPNRAINFHSVEEAIKPQQSESGASSSPCTEHHPPNRDSYVSAAPMQRRGDMLENGEVCGHEQWRNREGRRRRTHRDEMTFTDVCAARVRQSRRWQTSGKRHHRLWWGILFSTWFPKTAAGLFRVDACYHYNWVGIIWWARTRVSWKNKRGEDGME